jgi:kynurenine formamidase
VSAPSGADPQPDVRELGARLRNWGRWGPDDQLGTLNLITPAKRAEAAGLVRRGAVFSLQIPMDKFGPMVGPYRVNPVHTMTATGVDPEQAVPMADGARYTDDVMFLYLQSGTEWDGLSHMYYDDQLYNGYPASDVDSNGSHRLGMEHSCSSYVSRGVLLDVARWQGVECLDPAVRITGDDLDAVAAAQGVEVTEGDIVLLRTGILADWRRTGSWDSYRGPHPGLALAAAEWLHDHGVAAIAADNGAVEGVDKRVVPLAVPLHLVALRDMGLPFGESFYLEELADDCADDGVYECFLVAPALKITKAVGSPVNPLAMK